MCYKQKLLYTYTTAWIAAARGSHKHKIFEFKLQSIGIGIALFFGIIIKGDVPPINLSIPTVFLLLQWIWILDGINIESKSLLLLLLFSSFVAIHQGQSIK